MSLRAKDERGQPTVGSSLIPMKNNNNINNLVAIQGEEAQLRDCFVPRNDKVLFDFQYIILNKCLYLNSEGHRLRMLRVS